MAIKLDMKRAYDRLDWRFIRKCYQDLDFAEKWINWIMECITTSFLVLVNGIAGEPFRSGRGIRQGDPISLYIVIICTIFREI